MPYEKIFEELRKSGLISDKAIDRKVLTYWALHDVLDCAFRLRGLVEHESRTPEALAFDFVPTSEMSAQHGACCVIHECRRKRLMATARFATLYADRLRVPNYFAEYASAEHATLTADEEFELRYDLRRT